MTHSKQISQWLESHPEAAIDIACSAVTGLWLHLDQAEHIDLEADFPSGADYIDHVSDAIEISGCKDAIDEIASSTSHSPLP
jgi:hypothetical protein